ncbi:MAG: hypothetical protein NVS3B16_17690 [Vulcanimicrobiaceae bacterium]
MVRHFAGTAETGRDVTHQTHVRLVSEDGVEKPFDAKISRVAGSGAIQRGPEGAGAGGPGHLGAHRLPRIDDDVFEDAFEQSDRRRAESLAQPRRFVRLPRRYGGDERSGSEAGRSAARPDERS